MPERFPIERNPSEEQEGSLGGREAEAPYEDVLQDISRMEMWNRDMMRQSLQEENPEEAALYQHSLEGIQRAKNSLEQGDIGPALEIYTGLAGAVLKRLGDVGELESLSRQYPNVLQEQVKQAQEYQDFIRKLVLTGTGEPNMKAIQAAVAEKGKREIEEFGKQQQAHADEERQWAEEQKEILEWQKKFTEMSIVNGDVLVSKSGTQRKIMEVMYDPRRESGGSIEVEVIRDGLVVGIERLSFKDVVSAVEKTVAHIEKAK